MQQFTRYEFKYHITPTIAEAIRARLLRCGMKPDPKSTNYPGNTYPVTSLYFDTPNLDDYHDKAGGFLRRKKIRVRIYAPYLASVESSELHFTFGLYPRSVPRLASLARNRHREPYNQKKMQHPNSQQSEIWLEKKEKHEMLVSKKRVLLTLDDYDNLLYGSRLNLVKTFPLFLPLLIHGMCPTAMVRYVREPFISPHQSHLRITFDSSLEACQTNDLRFPQPMTPVAKGAVIMEVKFSLAIPYWFRLLLSDFHLYRQSFSKYGEAVEALYHFHPIPR